MLSNYPDYGKAPPDYLLRITEVVAFYSEAAHKALIDPIHGIAAQCRFLPTTGDIVAFLRAPKAERDRQLADRDRKLDAEWKRQPEASGYQRLRSDGWVQQGTAASRRAFVIKTLGYDPAVPPEKRQRTKPSTPEPWV